MASNPRPQPQSGDAAPTLHLPSRNDPIARLALLVIFGLALLVNLSRFDRPIANAKQDLILTATPALPTPALAIGSFAGPAPDAAQATPAATPATEQPGPASLDVAPAGDAPAAAQQAQAADPVVFDPAPEPPAPDRAAPPPEVVYLEAPAPAAELSAPTMPAPEPVIADSHGSKAAPDRAAHYAEATASHDNAPEQQHGAALDPASAARWCAAAASAGVARCIDQDTP